MRSKGKYILFIMITVGSYANASITDTVISLEHVVVNGVKFDNYAIGAKIITVDSFVVASYRMNSIGEMMSQQSIIQTTAYGPGGVASVKMRGGSADHTTIVWNGINLKPPMSGELNYSTLNVGMFDEIGIQPGGSSAMYGTGASTGVLFLSNKMKLSEKGLFAGLNLEAGSFSTYGVLTDLGYVKPGFGSRFVFSYQNSENNYKYTNTERFGDPEEINKHAAFNTYSVLKQDVLKIGTNTNMETNLLYIHHFKQIPSLTSDPEPGRTEQTDDNVHFALNFSHYGRVWFVKYRGGIVAYNNMYLGFDSAYYKANNRSWSYINELESKYCIIPTQILFLGINNTVEKARSSSYYETEMRNKFAIFGRFSSSLFSEQLLLNLEVRQSVIDANTIPFVYSAGMNYKIIKGLSFKALGSRLYSLPDLNDLYWIETAYATGNSMLKPEYGWSVETGIEHKRKGKTIEILHEVSLYNSKITDKIIWLPRTPDGKWMPDNYENISTYGIEFTGNIIAGFVNSSIRFGYNYTFTDAAINDPELHSGLDKQRRYIPRHKASIRSHYNYKRISGAVYLTYVGERNIDNVSLPLDDYFLLDLDVNYGFKLENSSLHVYAKVKNALNTNYRLMAGYSQQPRAYYIGINYKL